MTSAQHVFQVPELFELIFMELPMRTLLTSAQLVCRSWHQQITSSRRIQQALFLESCPPDTPPRINPLLAVEFPIFFDGGRHFRRDFGKLPFARQPKSSRQRSSSPPAPPVHSSDNITDRSVAQAAEAPPAGAAGPDKHGHLALREKFLHPSASWRRMLPRQPAVMEVGLWRYESGQGIRGVGYFDVLVLSQNGHESSTDASSWKKEQTGNGKSDARVTNKDPNRLGWTMGAIYDEGIDTVSYGVLSFLVFWDIQGIMRREAEEDQRRTDSDGSEYDSDGNISAGGGRDPGSNVRIAQAKVYKNVTSPDDHPDDDGFWETWRLQEALGDRNVVFQTIHRRSCAMGMHGGIAPIRMNQRMQDRREFETYFSFPAAKLDGGERST